MLSKKLSILTYHSVANDIFKSSIGCKKFEMQISLLKSLGFNSILPSNIYKFTSKNIIISFDDGYEDVYSNALPVLKKHNFNAICFIPTKYIGKYNDWDVNNKYYIKKKIMNMSQIKKWIASGNEVGIHGHSHYNFSNLNNKQMKDEIVRSINFFKKKLNIKIKYFSYPFGAYNKKTYLLTKKYFNICFTTKRSRYSLGKFDNMLIPRVPVNKNDSIIKFIMKIYTPYEDFKFKKNFKF